MGLDYKQEKPRVAVLMSSYNGEKYISEQIKSVLNQTYSNIILYIRDDESTDTTLKIIEGFAEKYPQKIKLIIGNHLGFVGSFLTLLEQAEIADYYAWCDQDDVWFPDKIKRAVSILQKENEKHSLASTKPILYFSGYDYYDEDLNYEKPGLRYEKGPSFQNALMDCITLGFCSVFNRSTRDLIVNRLPLNCCGHDWWTYMVCAAFGRVIYDRKYKSVKYRRLRQSVSPGGKGFIAFQIWRFRKFFVNDYFKNIRLQINDFRQIFYENLSAADRAIINMFPVDKISWKIRIKKVFYPRYFRQNLPDEIMVRILFLLGKI